MADPITRLREIVEAATPGPWYADEDYIVGQVPNGRPGGETIGRAHEDVRRRPRRMQLADAALFVTGCRLARAVADPAFVEKVAEIVHDFAADYRQDMPVDAVDCARSLLSLLASAAMGDD